jgi:hypothetical protein
VAQRRPSYKSIRARQRNILEGLGTSDLKYAQAAKRFGVTPRELKRFVETKPRKLRTNFNRSPANAKLYGASKATVQRREVRETLGVKRIRKYKIRESQIQDIKNVKVSGLSQTEIRNRYQIGEQIQNLYTSREHARYDWASYTREHDLPTSMDTIKLLHRNDKISDDEYMDAVTMWRDIYNITNARYETYTISDYDTAA